MKIIKHPNGKTALNSDFIVGFNLVDEERCYIIDFIIHERPSIKWGFRTEKDREKFLKSLKSS